MPLYFLQTRGTGALVVAAMLDFLTFALCAPYSETTDGKQFDVLLEKVADRGRTLYRLFQEPSHTIVKVGDVILQAKKKNALGWVVAPTPLTRHAS